MSFKDKLKTIIGLEEEEYETEFEEIDEVQSEVEAEKVIEVEKERFTKPAAPTKPVFTSISQNSSKGKGNVMSLNEMNVGKLDNNLSKVIIREPNEYSDTQDIADCLKQNFPVFVNLQRLTKNEAKRVVDFLSGTIYAIDGDIKRVGTNLFLCTPKTISTEGQISTQEQQLDSEE